MKHFYTNYLKKCFCIKNLSKVMAGFIMAILPVVSLHAQEMHDIPDSTRIPVSIHQEQTQFYDSLGVVPDSVYDALSGFKPVSRLKAAEISDCSLRKVVYGYWPYWGGSSYQNFQWNLLSDLVYHSYEINATTGAPNTVRDWATSAAVNKALEEGVRVSLNATLFSNHATFLNNPAAVQNFINNIIHQVKARNGSGICIDFETMASSNRPMFANFMIQLSTQLRDSIKGAILTLAIPSVEWSNIFDVVAMRDYVDYFVLMGYDYYYAGSAQAGPVGPLYSMTSAYNYNLNKSISTWIKKGIPKEQLILGLPYYGREWGTEGNTVPSKTKGSSSSSSRTLKYIHDNTTGFYTASNKYWENNSFNPYYIYSNSTGWRQCFIDDTLSLGKKLDLINHRDIAGMGIWALGYDHGYDYYWNVIKEKLSTCSIVHRNDSIFDSGGPAFNYNNNDDYTFTIAPTNVTGVTLDFQSFSTESGFDSLFIYNGKNTSNLIGAYTGTNSPGFIKSSGDALTLRVKTDGATNFPGWRAIWNSITTTSLDDFEAGVGHFDKAPVYNGFISFPCSAPKQTILTSKNGTGALEVKMLDLGMFDKKFPRGNQTKCHSLEWDVRLMSGEGLQANNIPVTGKGTISFWLKTTDIDTGTMVKIWIDDVDGTEESQGIKIISDGEWHYYIWDLTNFNGSAGTNGNGTIDGDTIHLDAIVFSRPMFSHTRSINALWGWYNSMFHRKHIESWTLYIDDVMHDRDVKMPSVPTLKSGSVENLENGNAKVLMNQDVVLYPNPNNGRFTVAFVNGDVSRFAVEVLNSSGSKVFSAIYSSASESIDLQHLPKGLYFLNISSEGYSKTVKLIIK